MSRSLTFLIASNTPGSPVFSVQLPTYDLPELYDDVEGVADTYGRPVDYYCDTMPAFVCASGIPADEGGEREITTDAFGEPLQVVEADRLRDVAREWQVRLKQVVDEHGAATVHRIARGWATMRYLEAVSPRALVGLYWE